MGQAIGPLAVSVVQKSVRSSLLGSAATVLSIQNESSAADRGMGGQVHPIDKWDCSHGSNTLKTKTDVIWRTNE
jgi:hypothetical protein